MTKPRDRLVWILTPERARREFGGAYIPLPEPAADGQHGTMAGHPVYSPSEIRTDTSSRGGAHGR